MCEKPHHSVTLREHASHEPHPNGGDCVGMERTHEGASPERARLLLADDHVLVAQGRERLLLECFCRIETVRSGEAVVEAVERDAPDIVVADISMDGMSGVDAMRVLRERGFDTPFLFLTMHSDPELAAEAIQSGASGYVLKASAGDERTGAGLTSKQREILVRVAQGLRSKQIAYELGLSVRTVESHKYTIMQELGVHSTVELVRKAAQAGLIAIDVPH